VVIPGFERLSRWPFIRTTLRLQPQRHEDAKGTKTEDTKTIKALRTFLKEAFVSSVS
jgi:hypothetical protein